MERSLFFIALLPPSKLSRRITEIKENIRTHYGPSHALKLPPHITLIPPFWATQQQQRNLRSCLPAVAHTTAPLKITYRNFGHFGNKVLYIALTTSPPLFALQQELQTCLQMQKLVNAPKKSFSPHTTLATRDIPPHQFETLWKEYREQAFAASFTAKELTLFQHDGERWKILYQMRFNPNP